MTRLLTTLLVEALTLAFGLDEPDRPPFRPEADAEGLPDLAGIVAEDDLVGFVEPDVSLAFDDPDGLRPAPAVRDSAGARPFAAGDGDLVEDRASEDERPEADERVAAFFFVVGMRVSVSGSVSESWGWNR